MKEGYNMTEYLSPKLDVVAKMIFERNTDLLSDLLQSVLDIPEGIEKLTILNPSPLIDDPEEKKSIMDIKVELKSGQSSHVEFQLRRSNLELQVREIPEIVPRLHYYKSRMVTEQLSPGDPYSIIVPISCVAILDFNLYDDAWCHHAFTFYDKEHDVEFSSFEEVHILEIGKWENDRSNQPLGRWLQFFNATEKEEFEMLSNESDVMRQAVGVLASLSADQTTRMIAEAREKELRDQMSRESGALAKGRVDGKREMARNLLNLGVSLDIIAKSSGLDETELRYLEQ
jgi:predicted transposase/invertase (TIGR01784 family)